MPLQVSLASGVFLITRSVESDDMLVLLPEPVNQDRQSCLQRSQGRSLFGVGKLLRFG